MAKLKQLKRGLPTDSVLVLEKGWRGNFSSHPKFITDAHIIILTSKIKGKKEKYPVCSGRGAMSLEDMQRLWDTEIARKRVPGEFIGCASVISPFDKQVPVAVIRKGKDYTTVNPWKLAFLLSLTGANRLMVSTGKGRDKYVIVALRGKIAVGMIAEIQCTKRHLRDYDLTGEAIPLGEK